MRYTSSFILYAIGKVTSMCFPTPEKFHKVTRIFWSCDQENIGDACFCECLKRIENHLLIVDRDEVFIGNVSKGSKTSSFSSSKNNSFHTMAIVCLYCVAPHPCYKFLV